ncbi:MAG: PIG-L family deacetylase [Firmicutes bacterium]|nr:PIG-L family deacetylase [Bacillota bacterium]
MEANKNNKRVLLLVPHEDDEMLVGGPMLVNLSRSGCEIFVFIATNGDYYPFESAARAEESLKALEMMGVPRDRVIFGGYGDSWRGKGIYDSGYDEEKVSEAGLRYTHGPSEEIDEWHYVRTGEHAPYTKRALLEDLYALIDGLRPDVILLVGFDSHPDHRALNCLSLEALAQLMKEDPSYAPDLLERPAYEGNLFGKPDHFSMPHPPSARPGGSAGTAFCSWERRLRYRVPDDCDTFLLTANLMFKTALCYRTQGMWTYADRFINSDVVFWQRNTKNRLLRASISASSGDAGRLNDLKLTEPVRADDGDCDLAGLCFRFDPEDAEKTVSAGFEGPCGLKRLLLYFNTPGGISADALAVLKLKDGSREVLKEHYESAEDFSVMTLEPDGRACLGFELVFENVRGDLGLGEIEALEDETRPPFEEFLAGPFKEERSPLKTALLIPEKLAFKVIRKIRRNIKTPYDRKKERYDADRRASAGGAKE